MPLIDASEPPGSWAEGADHILDLLREDGERKRRLAVQTERNREERFLDYCLKHPECYPTPHEWATWKKMRTHNRFRWYAR